MTISYIKFKSIIFALITMYFIDRFFISFLSPSFVFTFFAYIFLPQFFSQRVLWRITLHFSRLYASFISTRLTFVVSYLYASGIADYEGAMVCNNATIVNTVETMQLIPGTSSVFEKQHYFTGFFELAKATFLRLPFFYPLYVFIYVYLNASERSRKECEMRVTPIESYLVLQLQGLNPSNKMLEHIHKRSRVTNSFL